MTTNNNFSNQDQQIAELKAQLAKKNQQKMILKGKVIVINLLLATNFFGILTVGSVFFMQRIVAPQVQSK